MDSRDDLWRVLREPPRSHSPAAIWWWSGETLRRDRLRWQLERFVAGGLYNLVILNLAPSGPMYGSDADDPPFFSPAWWELLDDVCTDASSLGVSLWFYDQLGFSGADLQARLVQENPSYAGQWLLADGSVTSRGFDYLSGDACRTLLDAVHGEFERRLGHHLGSVIVGSFQDELPSIPTWSPGFAAEFVARRGYSLRPALLFDGGDPEVLVDYHRTRAELAEEAFFRPLAEWHDKHGLLVGCDQQDPARAGNPVDGVQLYADYARTHRWFSAPGSDHHGDARLHSSLAHLYGRPRTWIEAFHSSGWGGTLEETFDWLLPWLRAGATLYNPHAVYYSTRAGWWEWAPPSTDWRQPYWQHHKVFADAVTRLCAALSLGRHVCDVAVLLPTATVQAGTAIDSVSDSARYAQQVYRELIGDMAWFRTEPGVLDRLGVDADVIDEDSVRRAEVVGTQLCIADEAYSVILLPAATVLDPAIATRLAAFAAAGGQVVAIGAQPSSPELRDLVRFVPSPDELTLSQSSRVKAPVPVLVREVDGATVVFVTAASPRASIVGVGSPDERGIDLGWLDARCDFDPSRYADSTTLQLDKVTREHAAVLVDPFTGRLRELSVGDDGSVVVPFDHGPAALVIIDDPSNLPAPATPPAISVDAATEVVELGEVWECELVPTLDNTWGDFATGDVAMVERWELEHRLEDDADWSLTQATFGPHGLWRRDDSGPWQQATYSTSRGIHKDPIHRDTLGPKGHVPEEFLDFGEVGAGQSVWFRTTLTNPQDGALVVGAAAAVTVLLDGGELTMDDAGYLAVSRSRITPGQHRLEVRFTPDEPVRLRAHVSLLRGDATRPEWLTVDEPSVLSTTVTNNQDTMLQVASIAQCLVRVNGTEAGRQGGFDPYVEAQVPRLRRYDIAALLTDGPNEVTLETDGDVLVDGLAVSGPHWTIRPATTPQDQPANHPGDQAAGQVPGKAVSAPQDEAVTLPARVRRRQHGDPAALHLHRRPHPLPDADWLETSGTALPAVLAVPDATDRVEWFGTTVPPGATELTFSTHCATTVFVDGTETTTHIDGAEPMARVGGTESTRRREVGTDEASGLEASVEVWVELAGTARRVELRVQTRPGFQEGAALAGPLRFSCGAGTIRLGDWDECGLTGYSGGVRYRTAVVVESPSPTAVLDLGRVRGTADVRINGNPAGTRVCSPYCFEVGDSLRPGVNEIEVLVFNTLGPYLDAVSPTHFVFPGQRVSGLLGPVRLLSP